jgi:hypothetical protein
MLYYELGHYDHLYLNHSYCNVYGTGYQLHYVCHNNDSGIVMEHITGTSNFFKFGGVTPGQLLDVSKILWLLHVNYCLDLSWVSFDSSFRDEIP